MTKQVSTGVVDVGIGMVNIWLVFMVEAGDHLSPMDCRASVVKGNVESLFLGGISKGEMEDWKRFLVCYGVQNFSGENSGCLENN